MEDVSAVAVELCGIVGVSKDFQAKAAAKVIFNLDSTSSHISKVTYVQALQRIGLIFRIPVALEIFIRFRMVFLSSSSRTCIKSLRHSPNIEARTWKAAVSLGVDIANDYIDFEGQQKGTASSRLIHCTALRRCFRIKCHSSPNSKSEEY